MKNAKKNNTVPLWLELKNKLCAELMSGKFQDKDKFYTIREMCELFNVSDITARRAITELVNEKLLEKSWGRGCFVIKASAPLPIIMLLPTRHSFHSLEMLSIIFFEMSRGIFEGISEYNCELIPVDFDYIFHSGTDGRKYVLLPGTIFTHQEELDLMEWVNKNNHVCVNCQAIESKTNISTVRTDFFKGAYDATTYFLKYGCKKIALLSADIKTPYHAPRFDGYYKALKQRAINIDLQLVKIVDDKKPSTITVAMQELMSLDENKPDALLVTSSFHMSSVLKFCKKNNVRIPEDLAIISFDNTTELAVNRPPISVVDLKWRENSRTAIRLLSELSKADNPQPRDILLKPELVLRKST